MYLLADIYDWNASTFERSLDLRGTGSLGLPSTANVDGYDRVDATHFYLSFSATTTSVPGLGSVQDEDVLYYDAGAWSVWFDTTNAMSASSSRAACSISAVRTTPRAPLRSGPRLF